MAQFKEEGISALMQKARIGLWEADFKNQCYICSEFISDLLGLKDDHIISFKDFRKLIREDYRLRTLSEFRFGKNQNTYDQVYPLETRYGIQWVRVKLCSKETDAEGNLKTYGIMECMDIPDQSTVENSAFRRINNLFTQQNSISHSLLSLLKTQDMSGIINKILGDILKQFPDGNTYIVEYDPETYTHTCLYHAHSQSLPQRRSYSKVATQKEIWWTRQVIDLEKPIILSSMDELPAEAEIERTYLEKFGIKSLMIVPIYSRDKVWGYAGIDIITDTHTWQNEDYLWFSSMVNIISLCLELRKSEEKAIAEKQYLRNLYKHMPVGFIHMKMLYDEQHNPIDCIFLDINNMAAAIYNAENFEVGKRASETVYDLQTNLPMLARVVKEKQVIDNNFYLPKVKKYCHSILYSPQEDEIIILFSDMTETFTAHEALFQSEQILRNIYKNLPIGIELYDKKGIAIDINDKELEIFGMPDKDSVLGTNLFHNPLIPDKIKAKIRNKEIAEFFIDYDFSKLNGYYNSKHTGIINVYTIATPLYDSQNNFINYLFINIDKTESIIANKQIQKFKNFFDLVGDYAKVGYAHFDGLTRDGYALDSWYQNVGEKVGTPLQQIIGVHSHFHPEDQAAMIDFLGQVTQGKASHLRRDVRILRNNGEYSWTRVNVLVRNYAPQEDIIEMLCINYDITELKNIEAKLIEAKDRAEESDRLKSAFLANMSHEIRTPLNAIVGFSSLLAETDDQYERKQYLEIVEKNNNLLLQLITDILDLSKIEAGIFDIVNGDIDVNSMCTDLIKSLEFKIPDNVELRLGNHLPGFHIYSDKNRIHQIISNFVNNAVKFTTSGNITIGYLLREKEIEFYVSDTGIGIAPDKIDRIFERFTKLNHFVPGTGLGLSICKSLVKQWGGNIGVESEVGKGSRFWFTIPLE